jgi:hypothetical protein
MEKNRTAAVVLVALACVLAVTMDHVFGVKFAEDVSIYGRIFHAMTRMAEGSALSYLIYCWR